MPELKRSIVRGEYYIYTVSEHAEAEKYMLMYQTLKKKLNQLTSDYHALEEALKKTKEDLAEAQKRSKELEAGIVKLETALRGHRQAIRRYRRKLGLEPEEQTSIHSAEIRLHSKDRTVLVRHSLPIREPELLQDALDFARQLLNDLPKNLSLRRVYFDTRIHRFIAEYEAD